MLLTSIRNWLRFFGVVKPGRLLCYAASANGLATANPLASFRWHRSSKSALPLGRCGFTLRRVFSNAENRRLSFLWFPLSIDSNYGLGNFPAKICYGFTQSGDGAVSGFLLRPSRQA